MNHFIFNYTIFAELLTVRADGDAERIDKLEEYHAEFFKTKSSTK